jgi:Ras-related protein Rab-5C
MTTNQPPTTTTTNSNNNNTTSTTPAKQQQPTTTNNEERRFKLVVLGTSGVGKTCLTLRFVRGVYEEDQLPTIGAAYLTKKVGRFVYEIWDTAGQERYESITPLYYRSAQAAVIVFDVNDTKSFDKARDWLARLRKELDNTEMPIALAANKCDQEGKPVVDLEEAASFAREHGLHMFKTSAKNGDGVDEMFAWLAQSLPPLPTSSLSGGGGGAAGTMSGGGGGASTGQTSSGTPARLQVPKTDESSCC